jgi:hypothetical protein
MLSPASTAAMVKDQTSQGCPGMTLAPLNLRDAIAYQG